MGVLDNIANNVVKMADTKEEVTMNSFWSEKGLGAQELSLLAPQLQQANVRLIGIGLEELGVDEFIEGKYFTGELYIDTDKKSFKALNYKKFGYLAMVPALIAKVARDAMNRIKKASIKGDMKGDGFQMGGLLVVAAKGESILFEYRQENPAGHAENSDILKSLGLEATTLKTEETTGAEGGASPQMSSSQDCKEVCEMPAKSGPQCDKDVCEMPAKN